MILSNLEYLAGIIEDSKKGLRLSNKATILTLDSKVIAIKVAKALEGAGEADLTAWCGSLGKKILQGHEQEPINDPYNHFEKKARKLRIHTGWWIFRALARENILTRYRKDEEKHQWVIIETEKGERIINMILDEVPIGTRNVTGEPTKYRPLERVRFNDPIAGPLCSRYDTDDLKYWERPYVPKAYEVINRLQQTPYIINNQVLNVATRLKEEMKLWTIKKTVKVQEDESHIDEIVGLDRDENMCLEYANAVKDDTFYFYWNMDFRGRKYAMSTYLTPQGSKLSKSLIYFKNKKKLGSEGWFWLGVHCANTMGHDKLPIDDRFDTFERNIDLIRKVARNPLKNREWMDMDDPWGFLACCFEVSNAFRCNGGPYEYESGLMVGFDATTSGLQLLSMLSRDEATGALCNLTISDIIGDSYKFIADGAWEELNDTYWEQHYDKRRSIVKRSVMVKYYKCGKRKMGLHIWNDFKHELDGLTREDCDMLGELIFHKCDELLPGPKKVMDKFTDLGMESIGMKRDGKDYVKVKGSKVEDFTLELPVDGWTLVQRYRVDRTQQMKLKMDEFTIQARYVSEPGKYMNVGRVMTGTSVNIVHGLDSQIVSWLALYTDYDICPVHDCFSSVPSDAGKLFEDTRLALFTVGQAMVGDILKQKDSSLEDIEYGSLNPKHCIDNQYCMS